MGFILSWAGIASLRGQSAPESPSPPAGGEGAGNAASRSEKRLGRQEDGLKIISLVAPLRKCIFINKLKSLGVERLI